MKTYQIAMEIAGNTALWTRPDSGDSPCTYPAPTYSAARGLFESVLWGPAVIVLPERWSSAQYRSTIRTSQITVVHCEVQQQLKAEITINCLPLYWLTYAIDCMQMLFRTRRRQLCREPHYHGIEKPHRPVMRIRRFSIAD